MIDFGRKTLGSLLLIFVVGSNAAKAKATRGFPSLGFFDASSHELVDNINSCYEDV